MVKTKCSATGKIGFETKGDAQETMMNIKNSSNFYRYDTNSQKRRVKRRQGKPEQKRAYLCEHCDMWHLTSWETSTIRT